MNASFFDRAAMGVLLLTGITGVFPDTAFAQVTEAWVQRYSGVANGSSQARTVVTDADGNVIAAGNAQDGIDGQDILAIKYSSSGAALWTNRYSGPGISDNIATAATVDGSGNVFVAGASSTDGNSDYVTVAYSGAGIALWTNSYNGPGNGNDVANAITVDGNGNVFVTGSSIGTNGNSDYATIGYSSAGMAMWTNRYDGPANGDDMASAIGVNNLGNVFVTGNSPGNASSDDFATIVYSNAGTAIRTNRYNGPGNSTDRAMAMAVDGSGRVFVTGPSWGGSAYSYATIGYSEAGVPLWTNRYGAGSFWNQATAIAVDSNGKVCVTGYSQGSLQDYATVAYSVAGLPLWTNRYASPGNDIAAAIAVDSSGNVFVTGFSEDNFNDYATVGYSAAGVPLWTNLYAVAGMSNDRAVAIATDGGGNVFVTGNANSDFATIKYSGGGFSLWTNRWTGPANSSDQAAAVAVDGSGNVVVTGYSAGSNGFDDYLTIAYSSNGVPVWTNRYDGPGNSIDRATAIALDGSGNVIVTGKSLGTGGVNDDDYGTIAYSAGGVALWTNRYGGPANFHDTANALAVGSNGNVYVTGTSAAGSIYGYATIAYSGAGTALWTNFYESGNSFATAMAVDNHGHVFVTGHSGSDFVTIAYSETGIPLWTNRYNDSSDVATAMAVDKSGNVFVTGTSGRVGALSYPHDYATIAYSAAGVSLWINRYSRPMNYTAQEPPAVAVDNEGNVFVTGASIGNSGLNDLVTLKYSGTGALVWTNSYNGPANGADQGFAVAMDSSGNAYVTGSSTGTGGDSDFVTIKYSSAGAVLWTIRYDGPAKGHDQPLTKSGLALGPDGAVYVTGASDGDYSPGTAYDFVTVKYVNAPVLPIPLQIQKTSNGVVLSWTNEAFGLQSAPAATGAFIDILGASSPYTNSNIGSQMYFRLISN